MLYVFDTQAPTSTAHRHMAFMTYFWTTFKLRLVKKLPCLRFGYNVHRTFTSCDTKET